MRVLVTGSDGYLGQVVVPALQRAGHEVRGLDAGLYAGARLAGQVEHRAPTTWTDLRDVTRDDLEGAQAVVHLAALSNDPLGDLVPELTHEVNHRASVRLARLAREAGVVRFVYASTCSVYGASGGALRVGEDAPLAPVTPYAVSKVRVEEDLRELADERFSPVSLRNATCYGASSRLRLDVVLNDLVAGAVLEGVVTVRSDGTPWRPLAHVEDVATAVASVLDAPREAVHGEALNVGRQGEDRQVRDLAEAAAAAVPGSTVVVTAESGPDPRSYRVDFSRIAERVPAWSARWTVERGAAQLAAAYRAAGLRREDTDRFVRLRELRRRMAAGELTPDLRPVAA